MEVSSLESQRRGSLDPSTILAYLTPIAVLSAAWLVVMSFLFSGVGDPTASEDLGDLAVVYGSMVAAVAPAILIHRVAPPDPVDRFHHLGILFAMFILTNVIITIAFMALMVKHNPDGFAGADTTENVALYVVVSSLFLPGPYAGAVTGRWWATGGPRRLIGWIIARRISDSDGGSHG